MKRLVYAAFYWFLDYVYVARKEVRSVTGAGNAEQYRTAGDKTIVLIPGVYENWRFMEPIARLLRAGGYDVHVVEALKFNRGTIEDMANIVATYISEQKLSHIVIVAHSKGGLVGKYLMMSAQVGDRIDGMIALNTPFSGSRYAYILPSKALRIFTPKSKILLSLAENTRVNRRILSMYGIFDPHIPGGSSLEGARNVQLTTYGHFRILDDTTVHAAILKNIPTLVSTH